MGRIRWVSWALRASLALVVFGLLALAMPRLMTPPVRVVTPHMTSLPLPRPIPSAPVQTAPCQWLGVVIDNSIPAWPQAGLSAASIVYEFPAEGGITRLVAFYCQGAPEVVGPVRSLRIYMLDLAREYGATIAHAGESASALATLSKTRDPVINEFWQPEPFWRDTHRNMPHNLYTSIPALRRYIRPTQVPDAPPWQTAEIPSTLQPMTVLIPYGPGYDVRFEYDPDTSSYTRFIGGRLAVDVKADTPIMVASIVVQYVHWWQTYEGTILESRLDLVGSGPLVVFTAGRRIDGQWHRTDSHQPTVFTDLQGQPLVLQPGPTWINIVPTDRAVRTFPAYPLGHAQ